MTFKIPVIGDYCECLVNRVTTAKGIEVRIIRVAGNSDDCVYAENSFNGLIRPTDAIPAVLSLHFSSIHDAFSTGDKIVAKIIGTDKQGIFLMSTVEQKCGFLESSLRPTKIVSFSKIIDQHSCLESRKCAKISS
jgi:exosome complex RNA-binding protein Csl4